MTIYITDTLDPEQRGPIVERLMTRLRRVEFDAVVVCGVGGLVIGSIIAHAMKKAIFVVRKVGEPTHSTLSVDGPVFNYASVRFVVIDDCIASGYTMSHILAKMKLYHPLSTPVSIHLYGDGATVINTHFEKVPVFGP